MKINEVIVVEGKADTEKIKLAVVADTIETNGSALSKRTQQAIQHAAQTRGIIIFTDPDYNGERLRKILERLVPNASHAFLTHDEAGAQIKHHSLGIEYASVETIQMALSQATKATEQLTVSDITAIDLNHLGLTGGQGAAGKRQFIAETLGLGYVNGKQLLNRLHMFGISMQQLNEAIDQYR
ncbi:ribonuclease M5 [Weissella diestrammenae]|uniref:Ribonuclease M5 n=1 Tax=Weissella diestrammenae TaxID=1162633 RepID=A0A7G9T799_9LACO|nr:ribonuclease M5 [Weissella diestrammenae]MCM0581984.1 ribonuclease M5 [Weissella diestrammenae]QNN75974.1 ribonuclease M5 [Weissella diestrammenae]